MRRVPPSDVAIAARAIEAGELVIVPTDRWYMICCDAGNARACAAIFAAKKRPADKSLALVADTIDTVNRHFALTPDAQALAEEFWPGHLALRLPWRDATTAQAYSAVGTPEALVTIAPDVLGDLAANATCLVAATTANISGDGGTSPSINIPEVAQFIAAAGIGDPLVIDGGVCSIANHLTIVRCTPEATVVVREGVVHSRSVTAALHR
ncbi:Sua5/YciO/YrdC/YwlC family protein [Actinoplanes sp. NPDC051346]|uniref:L-threonylcarbamoyladenylate synthase n=1 Tax=Actinoplanes sp. NPDC051346 TaxID=3155048 RepID=UPI00342BC8F9